MSGYILLVVCILLFIYSFWVLRGIQVLTKVLAQRRPTVIVNTFGKDEWHDITQELPPGDVPVIFLCEYMNEAYVTEGVMESGVKLKAFVGADTFAGSKLIAWQYMPDVETKRLKV